MLFAGHIGGRSKHYREVLQNPSMTWRIPDALMFFVFFGRLTLHF